jgi:SNF2 family DNA or RNA helicase
MIDNESMIKVTPQKWVPKIYMKKGLKWLLEHACAGLLLKPGRGKTAITLAAISFLKKKGLINKVLVLAPKRVCTTVWPKEVKKWSDFNHLRVEVLRGKDRDAALLRDADIYVTNYESLPWLLQPEWGINTMTKKKMVKIDTKKFKNLGFDVLVIDELSKFKHLQSGRSKMLTKIIGMFGRRWGLTGSPAANGLMDLFGETFMLDQGASLGRYVTEFRTEYFEVVDAYTWAPQLDAEERIYERLSNLMMHVPETGMDLPELLENNIMIELDDESRRVYDQLEASMLTVLDIATRKKEKTRKVTAANVAVAHGKCRQVCCGGIYLDPELVDVMQDLKIKIKPTQREWINLHNLKVEALEDLVSEMQHRPLLVAYDFKHDLDRLRKTFKPSKRVVYVCDHNDREFEIIERRWNVGEIEVMFAHPQSIAHGLNLQESEGDVCWHSLTWNQEEYDQFIRRVWRPGNKAKHTTNHHIMAQNTIEDLVILPCLKDKDFNQQKLFNALLNLAKRRK